MRRLALALALALAATTLVSGCGGGSGGGSGSVRFLVFGDPEEIKAYRDVVAAFEREEPELDVQLVEAADREDLLTRLSTSFAGGSPPDVFLINYRFYGQFAAKGVLEPLQDRVEESDAFEPDDFYAVALDAFRWNGVLGREGHGLAVHRVREQPRRPADRGAHRPDRSVADRRLALAVVPRSGRGAEELANLPRRDPDDPAGADDLDLAPRSRTRPRACSRTGSTSGSRRKTSPRSSTGSRGRSSHARNAEVRLRPRRVRAQAWSPRHAKS